MIPLYLYEKNYTLKYNHILPTTKSFDHTRQPIVQFKIINKRF